MDAHETTHQARKCYAWRAFKPAALTSTGAATSPTRRKVKAHANMPTVASLPPHGTYMVHGTLRALNTCVGCPTVCARLAVRGYLPWCCIALPLEEPPSLLWLLPARLPSLLRGVDRYLWLLLSLL